MTEIYLDNAATTPMSKAVVEVIAEQMANNYGNASSTHEVGRRARKTLDEARQVVASAINAQEQEIVFTSGGSEGNNTVLFGVAQQKKQVGMHIITTKIEHPSVLNPLKRLEKAGFEVTYLDVDQTGQISLDQLKAELRPDTILVSVMAVNNEVGSIMPLKEIGELVQDSNAVFHVDAVQGLGNIDLDVQAMHIDYLTTSAHKINGPKFLGFLYQKTGKTLPSLIVGGEQELKRRAGTENVPAIAGFAEAIKESMLIDKQELQEKYAGFQAEILATLTAAGIDFQVNGTTGPSSSHHVLNLHLIGVGTYSLLTSLDLAGFAVSGGSACTAGSLTPSHVLISMYGEDSARVKESIRISFGRFTTLAEVKQFSERLVKIVSALQVQK